MQQMKAARWRRGERRGLLLVAITVVLSITVARCGPPPMPDGPLVRAAESPAEPGADAWAEGYASGWRDAHHAVELLSAPKSEGAVPVPVRDVPPIAWMPEAVARWRGLFETAGARWGVDPQLLEIVALEESCGNPRATSHAGARGLLQVMPATGRWIALQRGLTGFRVADLYKPEVGVDFGAWYLARQLRTFGAATDGPSWDRSVERAAVAYNGGPGTASAWLARGGLAEHIGGEAGRYRREVLAFWRVRHEPWPEAVLESWAAGRGVSARNLCTLGG